MTSWFIRDFFVFKVIENWSYNFGGTNMDNLHLATDNMKDFIKNIFFFVSPLNEFNQSVKFQLTFTYVCLCLHNINFHHVWCGHHIESQVIDINLLRFHSAFLIYARSRRKKIERKKKVRDLNDFTFELTCWRFLFLFSFSLLRSSFRRETN